jgi:hypothetical protein
MSVVPTSYSYSDLTQIEKGVNKELHHIEKNIIDVARQEFYETSGSIKDLSTALGSLKDANAVNFAATNLASSLAVQGSTAQITLAVRDMAANILADGQKTRDLINSQYATNLAKELNDTKMLLIESKADDRNQRDRYVSLQNGFNNQQILSSIQAMQSQLSTNRSSEVVMGNVSGTNNGSSANTTQVH